MHEEPRRKVSKSLVTLVTQVTPMKYRSSSELYVIRCLHKIRKDPSAWGIFHPRHVLDSSRLRSGLRAITHPNSPRSVAPRTHANDIDREYGLGLGLNLADHFMSAEL